MLFRLGGEQPPARFEEALDLFRSLSDAAGATMAALFAGLTALRSGDAERAEGLLQEGLRLCRSLRDAWSEAVILGRLGLVPLVRGDHEGAEKYFRRALSLARTTGNPLVKLPPLYQLAQVAQVRDDHRLAAERYKEALALGVEMGDVADVGICLRGLAECAVAEGDHARAGRLYGASDAALESTGADFRPPYISPSSHQRYLARARGELGEQTRSEAVEEGRRMPLEEAVGYALGGQERCRLRRRGYSPDFRQECFPALEYERGWGPQRGPDLFCFTRVRGAAFGADLPERPWPFLSPYSPNVGEGALSEVKMQDLAQIDARVPLGARYSPAMLY